MLCWTNSSIATGPSHAKIKILPIGYDLKGIILFKTYSYINPTGNHKYNRVKYGWLVVSANGIWRESPHIILDPEKNNNNSFDDKMKRYENEFKQNINWKSPPSPPNTLQYLIREYKFIAIPDFQPEKGKFLITWSPKKTIKSKYNKSNATQRTLHEITNLKDRGTDVKCIFYHAGVALFNNVCLDEKLIGAEFFIPILPSGSELEDPGVDYWEIDGISIIKQEKDR